MDNIIAAELEKLQMRDDFQSRVKTNSQLLAESKSVLKPKSTLQKIGYTFGELQQLDIPKRVEIIRGLARGENGLLNAVTNVGKSTLIRNVAISLILGKPFPPLITSETRFRVAIIDSEDTISFLRSDIAKMIRNLPSEEKELIRQNLLLICDVSFGDEDLKLNKPDHFNRILSSLNLFKPDIIFIDTISASFALRNENDNSEVKEFVMKPLKRLARYTNAALLASYHIGKAKLEEGTVRESAHRGRGASAFSDLSRVVFNLDKDKENNSVILSCGKIKGEKFADTILNYDKETRSFSIQVERKIQTNYEILLEAFADGKTFKRSELDQILDIPKSTLTRSLRDAVENGDLSKSKGIYSRNAQMHTPYSVEHLSISDNSPVHNNLQAVTKTIKIACEHNSNQEIQENEVEYF
ncbi:MAG TPA: AAA family ATPase [Pyrinomonadaceae bacterium]|nr:AAA family ATPase [Pyrinomonadaceae bacterium]